MSFIITDLVLNRLKSIYLLGDDGGENGPFKCWDLTDDLDFFKLGELSAVWTSLF